MGSALRATVLEAATPDGAAFPPSSGYTTIALIGCGACVLLALLTALLPTRRHPRPAGPAPAVAAADAATAPHDPR